MLAGKLLSPVPHPDNVILDKRLGAVRYAGPITAEDKKHWDRMLERDELQGEVSLLAGGYRRASKAKANTDLFNTLATDWKHNVEMYDWINEPLPERYHTRLEDRFYQGILESMDEGQAK